MNIVSLRSWLSLLPRQRLIGVKSQVTAHSLVARWRTRPVESGCILLSGYIGLLTSLSGITDCLKVHNFHLTSVSLFDRVE